MTAEQDNPNRMSGQPHPLDVAKSEAVAAASLQTSTGQAYSIGYGRPPVHTQFKPGQSGNPKGRPKGKRNMRTMRREIYVQPVKLANGRKVPAILAADRALLGRALKGDPRAALTAFKIAKEIGVYDEVEREPTGLTDEELDALTDGELTQLITIVGSAKERTRRPH